MTRRCSECRARLVPAATARATQRVCGPECRKRRRARQARRRRYADREASRADERERQKLHRERRRAGQAPQWPCRGSPELSAGACSGSGHEACHWLASARKCRNLQREVLEIVNRSLRVSRATFEREQARIARKLSRLAAAPRSDLGRASGRVTRHLRLVSACNGE